MFLVGSIILDWMKGRSQKAGPGPLGWGLGVKLTISPCKQYVQGGGDGNQLIKGYMDNEFYFAM
jgi:hypothetical protein